MRVVIYPGEDTSVSAAKKVREKLQAVMRAFAGHHVVSIEWLKDPPQE